MRHRNIGRQLGRNSSHRAALMRSLVIALVTNDMIKTTVPKAKELRRVIEPLITRAKTDTLANRRLAFNRLRDKGAVKKLFEELGPHFKTRPGGYMRILHAGFRAGDAAPMAVVQLVDRPLVSKAKAPVAETAAAEGASA